jgi:hypothetical protein
VPQSYYYDPFYAPVLFISYQLKKRATRYR